MPETLVALLTPETKLNPVLQVKQTEGDRQSTQFEIEVQLTQVFEPVR